MNKSAKIIRSQITICLEPMVEQWIRDEASKHRFSVSEYISHQLVDVTSVRSSLSYSKKIKKMGRITVAIPVDQIIVLHTLATSHKAPITKWISAVLTDIYNDANRKSNDELAAIALTTAICNYMDNTAGEEPRDVGGWEGMLYVVLDAMRHAKQKI